MSVRERDIPSNSRKSLAYRGKQCLNCGTPLDLSDRYCHNCGQRNSTKRLTAFDYFNELLMSLVTFDSRIYYTVYDLFFKPGTISRNYIAGKRVRYANPFRFFLSVSIIFFLLSSFLNYFNSEDSDTEINLFQNEETDKPSFNFDYAIAEDSLKTIEKKQTTIDLDYEYISPQDLDTLNFFEKNIQKTVLFIDFYQATTIADASQAMDSLNYEKSNYNLWLYKENKVIDQIKEDPKAFVNYIKGKVPFFLFFFTPIFSFFYLFLYFRWYPFKVIKRNVWNSKIKWIHFLVHKIRLGGLLGYLLSGILWLFKVRRNFNYFEHIVFNFHVLIFVFLGFLLCLLPDFLLGFSLFSGLFLLICPFYFYKAMRNFYHETRILTLLKFVVINVVFLWFGGLTAAFFFTAWAAIY